jgi:hypothetical protein
MSSRKANALERLSSHTKSIAIQFLTPALDELNVKVATVDMPQSIAYRSPRSTVLSRRSGYQGGDRL